MCVCVCVQQLDAWAELCVCGCGCCREGKGQLQLQPLRPHNVQEAKTETEAETQAAKKQERGRDRERWNGGQQEGEKRKENATALTTKSGGGVGGEGGNKHTVKCENAQFAFPSFAAKSVRNGRERESASSFLYLSLYLCTRMCECYLSIYPQIQTNLTVRSGSEVKFQKLPKGKQRKILQTSLALSLSLEKWN